MATTLVHSTAALLRRDDDKSTTVGDVVGPIVGVIVLILIAFGAWYGYRVYHARKLGASNLYIPEHHFDSQNTNHTRADEGLPNPSLNPFSDDHAVDSRPYPARGGIVGWVQAKYRSMRSGRVAGGAYEGAGRGLGRRGGRLSALDPDEAWDARMDREADADYEEQELGLTHSRHTSDARGYTGYGHVREGPSGLPIAGSALDDRYEDETGRSTRGRDPFADDHAEPSDMGLRAVSPRPHEPGGKDGTNERRSVFRENV